MSATHLAWLFGAAWLITTLVAAGTWFENEYLKGVLDELIRALHLVMEDDDE